MREPAVAVAHWLEVLEKRCLSELTFPEVRRALQALSSVYVERRARIGEGAALDGAGKRAAFALYYGPLHFILVREIVRALGAATPAPRTIVDLGCGTAAAGAAWAIEAGGTPHVLGVDRNGWAVEEARRTLRDLGLTGSVRRGDLDRAAETEGRGAIVAAFCANELDAGPRERLRDRLLRAAREGAPVLVVEPVAKGPAPWWGAWSEAFRGAGGRDDLWRFRVELPEIVVRLDRAAKLDHRELTGRTLWLGK